MCYSKSKQNINWNKWDIFINNRKNPLNHNTHPIINELRLFIYSTFLGLQYVHVLRRNSPAKYHSASKNYHEASELSQINVLSPKPNKFRTRLATISKQERRNACTQTSCRVMVVQFKPQQDVHMVGYRNYVKIAIGLLKSDYYYFSGIFSCT